MLFIVTGVGCFHVALNSNICLQTDSTHCGNSGRNVEEIGCGPEPGTVRHHGHCQSVGEERRVEYFLLRRADTEEILSSSWGVGPVISAGRQGAKDVCVSAYVCVLGGFERSV